MIGQGAGSEVALTVRLRETAPPRSGWPRREYVAPNILRAGLAKIWVAWDFLAPAWGPPDEVECDEIDYLEGVADEIVQTNVH